MKGATGVTNGEHVYIYRLNAAHLLGKLISIAPRRLKILTWNMGITTVNRKTWPLYTKGNDGELEVVQPHFNRLVQ